MRQNIRLPLLFFALAILLSFAGITIHSNRKRAASGEFEGLLLFAGAVVAIAYVVAMITRFVTSLSKRRQNKIPNAGHTVTDSVKEQFPNLFQLLGGYFHQDWCCDDPDAEAVLRRFMNDATPGDVQAVVDDIDRLLGGNLTDDQLKRIVGFGCYYYYDPTADGMSHTEWFRWVQNQLRIG